MAVSASLGMNQKYFYLTKQVSILKNHNCGGLVTVKFCDDGKEAILDVKCLDDRPYRGRAIPAGLWKSNHDS